MKKFCTVDERLLTPWSMRVWSLPVSLPEAEKKAEEEKGRADAEASRIYAEAYAKDPAFYAFWKSLESYKSTLPNFDATYSTNMDYFNYLYDPDGRR